MTEILRDPANLALALTVSGFAVAGSVGLAGLMRLLHGVRGRVLHALTLVSGLVAIATLALLAWDIDPGLGLIAGIAAGLGGGCFWLMGALVARARPVWVDALVILALLAFFTSYAGLAESADAVERAFPGLTPTSPADAP
jgi:hypothetical protein